MGKGVQRRAGKGLGSPKLAGFTPKISYKRTTGHLEFLTPKQSLERENKTKRNGANFSRSSKGMGVALERAKNINFSILGMWDMMTLIDLPIRMDFLNAAACY